MGTRVRKQPKAKRKSRRKAARRSVSDVTIPAGNVERAIIKGPKIPKLPFIPRKPITSPSPGQLAKEKILRAAERARRRGAPAKPVTDAQKLKAKRKSIPKRKNK